MTVQERAKAFVSEKYSSFRSKYDGSYMFSRDEIIEALTMFAESEAMKTKTTIIASGRKYGASFVRALRERAMLDPDAPDAIVLPSDCCYEIHSPREACKKDEPSKHLRMETVVSHLGGETSHLDDRNVPIHSVGNYTANDSTFPTEITFQNGRKVGIAFDGDKPYLTVGRANDRA